MAPLPTPLRHRQGHRGSTIATWALVLAVSATLAVLVCRLCQGQIPTVATTVFGTFSTLLGQEAGTGTSFQAAAPAASSEPSAAGEGAWPQPPATPAGQPSPAAPSQGGAAPAAASTSSPGFQNAPSLAATDAAARAGSHSDGMAPQEGGGAHSSREQSWLAGLVSPSARYSKERFVAPNPLNKREKTRDEWALSLLNVGGKLFGFSGALASDTVAWEGGSYTPKFGYYEGDGDWHVRIGLHGEKPHYGKSWETNVLDIGGHVGGRIGVAAHEVEHTIGDPEGTAVKLAGRVAALEAAAQADGTLKVGTGGLHAKAEAGAEAMLVKVEGQAQFGFRIPEKVGNWEVPWVGGWRVAPTLFGHVGIGAEARAAGEVKVGKDGLRLRHGMGAGLGPAGRYDITLEILPPGSDEASFLLPGPIPVRVSVVAVGTAPAIIAA